MQGQSPETTLQHPIDEPSDQAPVPSRTDPVTVGRGPGGLLTVAGLGMAAAGTALTLLPRFAPEFDWTVRHLASEGLMGGTFAAAGCVLIALGMASRAQSRFFRAASERSDADLMLEILTSELTEIRAEIRDTNQRVGFVRDETRGLFEAVQAREGMDGGDNETRDATFRMAASLDQLGARIDQRMNSREASIEQVFNELRQQLTDVRTLAEDLREVMDQGPVSADSGTSGPELASHPMDFDRSMDPSGEPMAAQAGHVAQAPSAPPQGLDLLESLDHQTEIKTSLRDQPAGSVSYTPIAAPELNAESEPRAPLPGGAPAPLSLSMAPANGPLAAGEPGTNEAGALLAHPPVRDQLGLGPA